MGLSWSRRVSISQRPVTNVSEREPKQESLYLIEQKMLACVMNFKIRITLLEDCQPENMQVWVLSLESKDADDAKLRLMDGVENTIVGVNF